MELRDALGQITEIRQQMARGEVFRGYRSLTVGVVGLLTWGVSILDVNQRIAGAAPILRPRVMTILGGVVIILIMVAGFVAGATAVRPPGS